MLRSAGLLASLLLHLLPSGPVQFVEAFQGKALIAPRVMFCVMFFETGNIFLTFANNPHLGFDLAVSGRGG